MMISAMLAEISQIEATTSTHEFAQSPTWGAMKPAKVVANANTIWKWRLSALNWDTRKAVLTEMCHGATGYKNGNRLLSRK